MPRITRAKAAQSTEGMHIKGDAALDVSESENGCVNSKDTTPTRNLPARKPLGEITPNSSGTKSEEEQSMAQQPQQQQQQTTTIKAGKGARKGAKGKTTEEAESQPDDRIGDMKLTMNAISKSPPAALGRSTRSRAGNKAPALAEQDNDIPHALAQPRIIEPQINDEPAYAETGTLIDAPASPLPAAMPNIIQNLRRDVPGKRSTSNKENVEPFEMNGPTTPVGSVGLEDILALSREDRSRTPVSASAYDALEAAVIHAATPPALSPSRRSSTMSPENAIDALDALEDAVEKVNAELPAVKSSSPRPKPTKKEAPVVRMTKGAQARISLAQGTIQKVPSWGPPRQSILGRSQSVRQGSNSHADPAGKRSSAAGLPGGERKEVVIPHSKPRPMSVSFPAPKPPVKSSKPPTKSTFHLPGEAVAAKLKAAREERAQKETDSKRTFKARPAPPPSTATVRETNASKFRQSLMTSQSAQPLGHRRANSVAPPKTRMAPKMAPVTGTTEKFAPGSLKVAKRPSTSMANIGKSAVSVVTSSYLPTEPSVQRVSAKVSGKEVFNRVAAAKVALEKEKREKEEATKQARFAAAERSRQASREWADKQKMKKLGLRPDAKAAH